MRNAIVRAQLRRFAEDVLLFQEAPGDRDDKGRWKPGAYGSKHVQTVVQPLSEAVRARVLGEGTRLEGGFQFYVLPSANVAPLRTGETTATGRAIIEHREVFYYVTATEPWPDSYVLAIGVRIDPQPSLVEGVPSAMLSGGDVALSGGQQVVS